MLKLVHLTDLHFDDYLWGFYVRLANKLNRIRPDLLLITGDVIDEDATEINPVHQFLDMLHPSIEIVAIPGNHDHKSNIPFTELKAAYEKHHCHLLINESRRFNIKGIPIMVTGLDDHLEGNTNIEAALRGVGYEDHHILLVHSPEQQEYVQQFLRAFNKGRRRHDQINISYILAGHNHGGQVRVGDFVPVLPEGGGNYVDGWYNDKPPYLYVSKGFGTSAVPFRFGARSELVLLDYRV